MDPRIIERKTGGPYSSWPHKKTKIQWGHSPYDYTVKVALGAGVKSLILFHHDPVHDDAFVDSIVEAAKKISWQTGSNMQILGAQEGLEVSLD